MRQWHRVAGLTENYTQSAAEQPIQSTELEWGNKEAGGAFRATEWLTSLLPGVENHGSMRKCFFAGDAKASSAGLQKLADQILGGLQIVLKIVQSRLGKVRGTKPFTEGHSLLLWQFVRARQATAYKIDFLGYEPESRVRLGQVGAGESLRARYFLIPMHSAQGSRGEIPRKFTGAQTARFAALRMTQVQASNGATWGSVSEDDMMSEPR